MLSFFHIAKHCAIYSVHFPVSPIFDLHQIWKIKITTDFEVTVILECHWKLSVNICGSLMVFTNFVSHLQQCLHSLPIFDILETWILYQIYESGFVRENITKHVSHETINCFLFLCKYNCSVNSSTIWFSHSWACDVLSSVDKRPLPVVDFWPSVSLWPLWQFFKHNRHPLCLEILYKTFFVCASFPSPQLIRTIFFCKSHNCLLDTGFSGLCCHLHLRVAWKLSLWSVLFNIHFLCICSINLNKILKVF